ncbi:HipA domain-containing protein [uncultured Fusobacterium sp.]|uniref:HipA domain-containing protein n=1 Tax=uncultured Fusobacterium sp. TaxID=159267 RepID=UPI0025E7F2BA|nr:HipA domain-containing protein [uncultured Fusobacterium sp.]
MFKLMCFNVFSHNRDDHSKNFTFLYLEDEKRWVLSPAYDLTYSFSIGGEHATTVNGNGKNPSLVDILAVAENIGIKKDEALNIATEIKGIVEKNLSYFLKKKR